MLYTVEHNGQLFELQVSRPPRGYSTPPTEVESALLERWVTKRGTGIVPRLMFRGASVKGIDGYVFARRLRANEAEEEVAGYDLSMAIESLRGEGRDRSNGSNSSGPCQSHDDTQTMQLPLQGDASSLPPDS